MLKQYISEYTRGFSFKPCEYLSYEICDIKVEINVMTYRDALNRREKAHVSLQKGNLKYACAFVESHDWENCFYRVSFNGRTYLCFRKTLYGFTLLDTETLLEEYDYFPAQVLAGEESFIIVDAKSFGNLIIFDGCYWAYPYECFAYDHAQKHFLNLSNALGLRFENSIVVQDTLILTGYNEKDKKKEIIVTQEKAYRLLDEKGMPDF